MYFCDEMVVWVVVVVVVVWFLSVVDDDVVVGRMQWIAVLGCWPVSE